MFIVRIGVRKVWFFVGMCPSGFLARTGLRARFIMSPVPKNLCAEGWFVGGGKVVRCAISSFRVWYSVGRLCDA